MRVAPAATICGAGLATATTAEAELLPGAESSEAVVTVAVFVSRPAASGVTLIVTVASAPAARSPNAAMTEPLTRETEPWDALAEPKARAGSSGRATEQFKALPGPPL